MLIRFLRCKSEFRSQEFCSFLFMCVDPGHGFTDCVDEASIGYRVFIVELLSCHSYIKAERLTEGFNIVSYQMKVRLAELLE